MKSSLPLFLVGESMTENSDRFSDASETEEHYRESALQELIVRLELPSDLAEKIQQCSQQSGETQVEVILAILKSTFAEAVPEQSGVADAVPPQIQQEFRALKARLSQLEALMPRLDALEGKSMVF